MKKATFLGLALGLATLAGLSGVSTAFAQNTRQNTRWGDYSRTKANNFTGVWRLDARHGDLPDGRGGGWNDQRDRDGRYDRDEHGDGNDRYGSNRNRGNLGFTLPEVIRIESGRRELRVENRNGRLLREITTGSNRGWRSDNLRVQSTVSGARITEVFSLQNSGRRLVVRTIVDGRRGAREFTSVYDRA